MAVLQKLTPGTVLQDRYKVLSVLGEGGVGVVYLVEALKLRHRLALKESREDFADDATRAEAIEQFRLEAAVLAGLDHPGLPKVLDSFEQDGRAYLAMDYLEGQTLEQVALQSKQYLTQPQVLSWMYQVAQTLAYLHGRPKPIVVRDLKPSNIMLCTNGQLKLIDFGTAQVFGEPASAAFSTGSAGFAAPEQYGDGIVDARTDIYALGASMYFLLTKQALPDAMERVNKDLAPRPPSFYNPGVSHKIDEIVMQMLSLSPHERPRLDEILEALHAHATGSGDAAPHESVLAQTAVRLRAVNVPTSADKKAGATPAKSSVPRWAAAVALVCALATASYGMWRHQDNKPAPAPSASAKVAQAHASPSPGAAKSAAASRPAASPLRHVVALENQPIVAEPGILVALDVDLNQINVSVKTHKTLLNLTAKEVNLPAGLHVGSPVIVKYQADSRLESSNHETVAYSGVLLALQEAPKPAAPPPPPAAVYHAPPRPAWHPVHAAAPRPVPHHAASAYHPHAPAPRPAAAAPKPAAAAPRPAAAAHAPAPAAPAPPKPAPPPSNTQTVKVRVPGAPANLPPVQIKVKLPGGIKL
jgi:serine/threonine-protein kinase